jgi:N-acetylmuramoyl-L-alanine amidase
MQDIRLSAILIYSFLIFFLSSPIYTQNNLPKKIIVIDPGHGGKDIGTAGQEILEKDVTLKIALEIGEYIEQMSKTVEVSFTRQNDKFLPLHERVNFANRRKADLFLSIHCNAVNIESPSGIESYVLGVEASEENLEISKRENASILHEQDFDLHYDGFDPYSPAGHVLLSALQNDHMNESIELAHAIQMEFEGDQLLRNRGVKQGSFVVLRKAMMPAILLEVGFLSNLNDEKKLTSKESRSDIIRQISSGVINYLERQSSIARLTDIVQSKQSEEKMTVNNDQLSSKHSTELNSYKILIASSSSGPLDVKISNLDKSLSGPFEEYREGVYEYYIGHFTELSEALLMQNKLRNEGFNGAYTIKASESNSTHEDHTISLGLH